MFLVPLLLPYLDEILGKMTRKALELGGTSTGEHGVGLRKLKYQEEEHGEALSLMQQVKEMFDPLGLLNPGKVIPKVIPKMIPSMSKGDK